MSGLNGGPWSCWSLQFFFLNMRCIEPKFKGPDKRLECMPSGMYSVYEEVEAEEAWVSTPYNTTAKLFEAPAEEEAPRSAET